MTRFIMTLEDSVQLLLQAAVLAVGGEVFVTKMPVVSIPDLAAVMIEVLAPKYGHRPMDVSLKIIGPRPGEKIYEELLNDEEARRATELEKFIIIAPAIHRGEWRFGPYIPDPPQRLTKPYNSSLETLMTRDQLRQFLLENHLLKTDQDTGR
jgi:FlaA1/EpsC-like NDP-sugar epimerase